MKKVFQSLIILFIIVAFFVGGLLLYRAIVNDDDKYYVVTFDSNGGSKVSISEVRSGHSCNKPSEKPTKEDYAFVGWFKDLDDEEEYNFDEPIEKDITLYAKWKKKLSEDDYLEDEVEENKETNKEDEVEENKETNKEDEVEENKETNKEDEVEENKETNKEDDEKETDNKDTNVVNEKKYTVTFDSVGGSEVQSQTITEGKRASKPKNPTRSDYYFKGWTLNGKTYDFSTKVTSNITLVADWSNSSVIKLKKSYDLVSSSKTKENMKNNTSELQRAIDYLATIGGGTVYLPSGTYYFSQGATSNTNVRYAIKARNNVHVVGAGTNEANSKQLTELKPYFKCSNCKGSMDMFYFDNYSDTGYNDNGNVNESTIRNVRYYNRSGVDSVEKNQTVYLINADFSDFVINASEAVGGTYKNNGRGFMLNLCKNCDLKNIIVKNTDSNGFNIDCPINSTIKNSMAINCGKAGSASKEGASGFRIGTGYSNNESITIKNSVALNNKKFGIYFEHKSSSSGKYYPARSSSGFRVEYSVAGGNTYDFGGLKAADVTYKNIKSVSGTSKYSSKESLNISNKNVTINTSRNVYPIYFSNYSKNVKVTDTNLVKTIKDEGNYKDFIRFVVNNGIMTLNNSTTFSPKKAVKRVEAVKMAHMYNNNQGIVNSKTLKEEYKQYMKSIKEIGFTDLGSDDFYYDIDSIVWARDKGLISKNTKFRPNDAILRSELVTMLYGMAGKPSVSGELPFKDVKKSDWFYKPLLWAYNKGIIAGTSKTEFSPNDSVTRIQFAVVLYRYNKKH